MTTQKKKKSAKQKRVLIGSVVVAVAIVAGSTFAWFSSKDEVTNRLTASADYNVSIVEDFQPPADWLPGQTINKDVSAVNTGNVDAFVRMWLDGAMRLLSDEGTTVSATAALPNGLQTVTDQNKTKLGLNFYQKNTSGGTDTYRYFKTLSTEKTDNPNDSAHPSIFNEETNQPARFSEVQSVQAGGVLVYAPNNAGYHWTLEQAAEMFVDVAANTPPSTLVNLPKGTVVGSPSSNDTNVTQKLSATDNVSKNYYGAIDASTFTPETEGLYIFRRTIGETADGTANKFEYSGYYYKDNVYYALHTGTGDNGHSDYVLPTGAVTENNTAEPSKDQVLPVTPASVYFYTAAESVITDGLTWTYNSTNKEFTVRYTNNGKPISIKITLANVGNARENWTALNKSGNADKLTTFYYNNDLEAGDTTAKLVDSVTLDGNTELGAYLAFDFDLNVFMESQQVIVADETGKETYDPIVKPWAATMNTAATPAAINTAAEVTTATYVPDNSEIDTLTWNIPTT